jgi:hypothetical protein
MGINQSQRHDSRYLYMQWLGIPGDFRIERRIKTKIGAVNPRRRPPAFVSTAWQFFEKVQVVILVSG